jgi:hypothetical protein
MIDIVAQDRGVIHKVVGRMKWWLVKEVLPTAYPWRGTISYKRVTSVAKKGGGQSVWRGDLPPPKTPGCERNPSDSGSTGESHYI